MDNSYRKVIIKLRSRIEDDVNVDCGVMDRLIKDKVLDHENIFLINNQNSREAKIKILLTILLKLNSNALKSFHESLEPFYNWLYKSISDELSSNRQIATDKTPDKIVYDTTDLYRSPMMPMPPELNIHRSKKTEELTDALKELLPEKYVVLHGMKGYGKSCLASMTLRNSPVIRGYFNEIWWMNFGCKEPLDDFISTQLCSLYHKIINSTCNYSICHPQEAITNTQIEDIHRELKTHFDDCPIHRNSLLVLDDVSDRRIIESFNFRCKILVLTTDIEVLDINHHDGPHNRQMKIIKMHDGFTEEESLQLFALAVNTKKEKLPIQAKMIHQEFGGMPILIAMFAAHFPEFRDDMKKNQDRWQYYLKAIRNKDVSTKIVEKSIAKQTAIFNMCINQLSVEEKSKYFHLAIFGEDVNITSETLSILWEDQKPKVDEFMVNLRKKSLVFKWWNDELDTYIYGVHELLLSHLRKLNERNLVTMHKEFVMKYLNYCNNDLSKLPTDNYSYSYIGHHLEEAQMYDKFQSIFLNFQFIQSKICNSGVNDLLRDLKKYRRYIKMSDNVTQEEEIENKIVDLENFLKRHAKTVAEYRNRGCLDLIQMALSSNTNEGFVYETAKRLASSKAKEQLFLLNHYKPLDDRMSPPVHHEQYQETGITEMLTIHFTDDPDKMIIGGKSGKLTRWDFSETKKHIFFYGFDKKSIITKVIVSHSGKFFIALNNQSMIKIFNLSDIEEVEDVYKKIHPSEALQVPITPIEKQTFWSRINNGELEDMSLETLTLDKGQDICDMILSSDDEKIAVCTTTGIIKVWNLNYRKKVMKITELEIQQLENQPEQKPQKQLLAFSAGGHRLSRVNENGDIFIFVWNNNIYNYKTYTNQLPQTQSRQEKLIYFKEIYDESNNNTNYILVTDSMVIQISFADDYGNPRKEILVSTTNNTKFTTATLTNDENYLITADNEDLIKIWPINGLYLEPEKIYKERAIVLDTYCDDHHIIAWGNKNYIQKMIFEPNEPQSPQIVTSIFDAIMFPTDDENPNIDEDVVIQNIYKRKMKLSLGVSQYMIEAHEIINKVMLNSTADKIFYVTNGRRILRCDVISRAPTQLLIMPLEYGFIKFIEYKVELSNDVIVVWKSDAMNKDSKNNLWIMNGTRRCTEGRTIRCGFIRDIGEVVAFEKMNERYAIVITEEEKFIIWNMANHDYTVSSKEEIICQRIEQFSDKLDSKIFFSAASPDGSMLAVLKTNSHFHLYTIQYDVPKDDNSTETCTKMELYFKGYDAENSLKSCAFSPDNKYLAVGTSNGKVLLLNITTNRCFIQGICDLHKSPILQLHWAPRNVGVPILLTINFDELAWWKADLIINQTNEKRRSRLGMTRSATIPPPNSSGSLRSLSLGSLPNYRDIDTPDGIASGSSQDNSNNHDSIDMRAYEFWSSKKVLHDNKWPGLLGLVQLHPHGRGAKICVSSDFRKFLSVDNNGSINKLVLFELRH